MGDIADSVVTRNGFAIRMDVGVNLSREDLIQVKGIWGNNGASSDELVDLEDFDAAIEKMRDVLFAHKGDLSSLSSLTEEQAEKISKKILQKRTYKKKVVEKQGTKRMSDFETWIEEKKLALGEWGENTYATNYTEGAGRVYRGTTSDLNKLIMRGGFAPKQKKSGGKIKEEIQKWFSDPETLRTNPYDMWQKNVSSNPPHICSAAKDRNCAGYASAHIYFQ